VVDDETDGWTSAGLGLFTGADRVATFDDPVIVLDPEPVEAPTGDVDVETVVAPATTLGGDGVAVGARSTPVEVPFVEIWPDATPTTPRPVKAKAATAPQSGTELVPAGDPWRLARERLLTTQPQPVVIATWGVRGAVRRGTAGLVRPAPSAAERAHLEDTEAIRKFIWPGPFNVLVANKKGGVGRTPTALIIGGALAQIRGGGVCVFEASESAGTLSMRAEGSTTAQRGLAELLTEISRVRNAATLAWFTQLQSSHAVVIGSVHDRDQLEGGHVAALRGLLDQYFPMTVADSGTVPDSSAFDACIDRADALVLPTTLAGDSVLGVLDTLTRVRDEGLRGDHLAATALIVITDDGRPVDPHRAAETRAVIDDLGVGAVVTVPHDPHIAAGTEICLGRLSTPSQRAWVHATAQALACASERLTNQRRALR
jgi:MinD-like ATPase involved in chromosome partitioning or flagellar assembly